MLEAGINVVTTADWVTGHHRDTNHRLPDDRTSSAVLRAACERGNATFHGTGMNPGLAQILTIVHSADVADIEKVFLICDYTATETPSELLPSGGPADPELASALLETMMSWPRQKDWI